MEPNHKKDAAFSHLMNNMLDGSAHAVELAEELVNDRHEQLLAMQCRFAAAPVLGFRPGQIVQWKADMKNKRLPAYGEPAIVMEVLNPPVYDDSKELGGSNLFREPLTVILGINDTEGEFLTFHFDGRRFEVSADKGEEQ